MHTPDSFVSSPNHIRGCGLCYVRGIISTSAVGIYLKTLIKDGSMGNTEESV